MTDVVKGNAGGLLLGTRAELEADIARLVHSAGAARGVLRFTDPQPWPGMPGKFYVRVGIVRMMERPAPRGRRGSLVATVAGVVVGLAFLVIVGLGVLAWHAIDRAASAPAASSSAAAGLLGLLVVAGLVWLAVRRRTCSTTVRITHHH